MQTELRTRKARTQESGKKRQAQNKQLNRTETRNILTGKSGVKDKPGKSNSDTAERKAR